MSNEALTMHDDFNWSEYQSLYSEEIKQMVEDGWQFFLTPEGYDVSDGHLTIHQKMVGGWKAIYNAIWELKPSSVLECGCGACHHLKNIRTLLPKTKVYGYDLLQSQIDFGLKFSNLPKSISNNICAMDMTGDVPSDRTAEFVYSFAVVMHLEKARAERFLRNMDKCSTKYIYLAEGERPHLYGCDFATFVKDVFPGYTVIKEHSSLGTNVLVVKADTYEILRGR